MPSYPRDPGPPEATPLGRAALHLAREVDVRFLSPRGGLRAVPGRWEPVSADVVAVYDRYPSQSDPDGFAALLGAVPVHNPWAITALCRDKIATQALLAPHVPMPEIEADPARFPDALAAWGVGFLKPRQGSFGRGIRRVVPGDPLPSHGEGAVRGVAEPLFLQRAVGPPVGWAGVCARVLVQRVRDDWVVEVPVARRSRTDPVVNAARGAGVALLDDPGPAKALTRRVAEVFTRVDPGVIELGVDLVIDASGAPWVIEVNARPRGRLEALAALDPRWDAAHVEAASRPLRWLAARYGG